MAINVSVTVPSTTLLDARARSLPDLLRASVHYFNAEEEIERFVGAITQIVS
jgi:selenocysteine lyase/cysteine desulfurase